MKKQIEIELKELAQAILNTNSSSDITILKKQAAELYEHLCVLDYFRNNKSGGADETPINTTISEEKEESTQEIKEAPIIQLDQSETSSVAHLETKIQDAEKTILNEETHFETTVSGEKSPDLLYELEELTAGFENMPEFERATPIENPDKQNSLNQTITKPKSSLNESLKKGINIGLNDRLAFVKHLFDNNQGDYTRVISQLNTLETSAGAKNFIDQMVKPEYNNWEGKEAYEERFINAVFTKFEN